MTDELARVHAPTHGARVREEIARLEAERRATVDRARALFDAVKAKALERFQRQRDAILTGKPADPPKPQPEESAPKPEPRIQEDELIISLSEFEEDSR